MARGVSKGRIHVDRGVARTPSKKDMDSLLAVLRTHPTFKEILDVLEDNLREEREHYEQSTASEYTRGRVNMMREIIETFRGK